MVLDKITIIKKGIFAIVFLKKLEDCIFQVMNLVLGTNTLKN